MTPTPSVLASRQDRSSIRGLQAVSAQRAALGEKDAAALLEAPSRMGLHALLAATARRHPDRASIVDSEDKPGWSGRPAITWTYATALEVVGRLAAALRRLDLPPASRVGLSVAGASEGCLALLAIEAAGLVPCLMPIVWDERRLLAAAEVLSLRAIIAQGQIGEARPAETACRVAAAYFGLRFVAGFGPNLPDGVISLDQAILDHRSDAAASGVVSSGIVTFAGGEPAEPVLRDGDALSAATALHLVAARIEPGERIVSLLPPSDLRGIVTGLSAALLAGATYEAHPVPDAQAILAAVERPGGVHLVVPAWMEGQLAGAATPPTLRSLTFVRRAPADLPPRAVSRTRTRILDAIAFDETAVLTAARERRDIAAVLATPERLAGSAGLIGVRRDPDGGLAFRGPASRTTLLHCSTSAVADDEGWIASRFRVEVSAGRASAVTIG